VFDFSKHFKDWRSRESTLAEVTCNVGLGTFNPVESRKDSFPKHKMDSGGN